MTAQAALIPGLERIRARFLDMLVDRLTEIETLCEEPSTDSLRQSQQILHKIAGSAGTLGLQDLGETARVCETRIIEFLDTGNMELSQVYQSLGDFAEIAEDLLTEDR